MNDIAVRGRPFLPDVSGNPNGRPPRHHTRHQFSNAFMDDLSATWAEYGMAAMQRTARESPQSFIACALEQPPRTRLATAATSTKVFLKANAICLKSDASPIIVRRSPPFAIKKSYSLTFGLCIWRSRVIRTSGGRIEC